MPGLLCANAAGSLKEPMKASASGRGQTANPSMAERKRAERNHKEKALCAVDADRAFLLVRIEISGWLGQGNSSGCRYGGTECRVQVTGYRLQGTGYRVQVQCTGYRVQGAGYRVQGTGYRVQGAGCRLQVTGYRLQVAGYRLQGTGTGHLAGVRITAS